MVERYRADVAVVGAGPAGLAAAVSAAACGANVVLLDEADRLGGQIWRPGGKRPPSKAGRRLQRIDRSAGIDRVCAAKVVDVLPARQIVAEREGSRVEVDAEHLILATGARELFLPFPGWTLPGVVGIGASQALVKGGLSIRNVPTIIAGTGPLVLPAAASLSAAGACLDIVADQAPGCDLLRFAGALWRYPQKWVEAARYRLRFLGCSYLAGTWVVKAEGDHRLRQVELTNGRRTWTQPCELLCTSYGLVPNIELADLIGCAIENDRVVVDGEQRTSVDGVFCAGEPTGVGGAELALCEGQIAGAAAARGPIPAAWRRARARWRAFARLLGSHFELRRELVERVSPSTTICRCEDVEWGSLDPSWGFRQAKLYSRIGMGSCQGRVCGPALGHLCGWEAGSTRPPVKTCRVGTLIG